MMVNRHKYFRFTGRTGWITFAYVILVPGLLGTAGYMTEVSLGAQEILRDIGTLTLVQGKWEMRGKRRGDLISEF